MSEQHAGESAYNNEVITEEKGGVETAIPISGEGGAGVV